MKTIELRRLSYTPKGTPGAVMYGGRVITLSLELPWKDNERNISCIPTGIYACEWNGHRSNNPSFRVLDVYDRTGILIHSGNMVTHSQGCILLGTSFQKNFDKNPDFFIENSGESLNILYKIVGEEDFWLDLTD